MGFYIFNEEGKQHINLSEKAMKVIESDMIRFNDDYELNNKSGFMNAIITHYYDSFPLSRGVVLKQINAIEKAINTNDFSSKLTKKVIEIFSEEITKTLIKEHGNKYSYDIQFKLKLNKENIEILETLEEAVYFEDHAPRSGLGFYIKILLESYARLNKEERQKIYFKDVLDKLKIALTEKRMIVIKEDNQTIKIQPHSFYKPEDKEIMEFLYYLPASDDGYYIQSIKIKDLRNTNFRVIKEKYTKPVYFSDFFRKRETVSARPTLDFIVEFSPYGLDRFLFEEDKLPIIGIPHKDNKYRYTFTTNETQIFLHLFKFGSQAKIIEPNYVQNTFKELYKKAYEVYENTK